MLASRPGDPVRRYAPGPAAPVRTNGWAIASLVLGIVAWFAVPIVGAAAAIYAGLRARAEIRRTAERGLELATAGLVLGGLQLGLGALALLVLVALLVVLLAVATGG